MVWLSYGILTSLLNFIFRSDMQLIRAILFNLKHIEYIIIYYYLYYSISTIKDAVFLLKTWLVFIWIHLSYMLYQIINNIRGFYGPKLIGEYGPFNITGQLLVITVYAFTFYLFYIQKTAIPTYKKCLYAIACIAPLLTVMAPLERIGFAAMIVVFPLSLLIYGIKKKEKKTPMYIASIAGTFFILFSIVFFSSNILKEGIQQRLLDSAGNTHSLNVRAGIWWHNLRTTFENPFYTLIGRGVQDEIAEDDTTGEH